MVTDLSYSHTHYNGKDGCQLFTPPKMDILYLVICILCCAAAALCATPPLELEMNLCEVLQSQRKPLLGHTHLSWLVACTF